MIGQRYRRGGSYLASLSDLMIGLLFIFIIILMAFTLSYKAAEEAGQRERSILASANQALTDSDRLRAQILQHVQRSLEQQGIRVQVDLRNGVLRLPESLLFDEGSAEFRPGGVAAIAKVASALSAVLPCYAAGSVSLAGCSPEERNRLDSVFIEGHTDNVPIQSVLYRDNWDLSVARARVTYFSLFRNAPDLQALINGNGEPLFSMTAYADTRPAANNSTADGRAENRRIDLRFIMTPPAPKSLGAMQAPNDYAKKTIKETGSRILSGAGSAGKPVYRVPPREDTRGTTTVSQ